MNGPLSGELQEAIRLHDMALAGDRSAGERALAQLSEIVRRDPGNALAAAYEASAMSLTGRNSGDTARMFERAIKAMIALDRVVEREPSNVQVRLIRARHSLRLPEPFFHRTATAISDFEWLLHVLQTRPGALASSDVESVRRDLALAYERLGMKAEAERAWRELRDSRPAPDLLALAESRLAGRTPTLALLPPAGQDELLKEGIRQHHLGVSGDREAVQKALGLLASAHERDPKNPLALAYYGSAVALSARDSAEPGEMYTKAIQGLMLLRQAVDQEPGNPTIHALRGYLCFSLPESFFHLSRQAVQDFLLVVSAYEQGSPDVPEAGYWMVLRDLGFAYQKLGEEESARQTWRKLRRVCTDKRFLDVPSIV
ncbi:MAG: hypothetical protein ACM3RP_12640 [Chitinophagales bacterium]